MAQAQTTQKVLLKTVKDVITLTEKDGEIEIKHTHYPIPPWGNNVRVYIYINSTSITVVQVNDGWNGTGAFTRAQLKDAELAKKLAEKARQLQSVEEFEEMVRIIEEKQEEIGKKIDEEIKKLIEKLQEIEQDEDVLSFLKSPEALEEIKEMLYERFSDP